jgi:hypothetical protein
LNKKRKIKIFWFLFKIFVLKNDFKINLFLIKFNNFLPVTDDEYMRESPILIYLF